MRKVILKIDNSNNIIDAAGNTLGSWQDSFNESFEEDKPDVAKLMSLGATTDEILKLKVGGLL